MMTDFVSTQRSARSLQGTQVRLSSARTQSKPLKLANKSARSQSLRLQCAGTAAVPATLPGTESPIKPRKVFVFVEPSPFAHISGMRNRFLALIESLTQEGDEVTVVTPDDGTTEYHGAKVIGVHGFQLPIYTFSETLLLSTGLSLRVFKQLIWDRPDIVHCATPSLMATTVCFACKLLRIPLVTSYHTHVPMYIPKYNLPSPLVGFCWWLINLWSSNSALTLVTSQVMKEELEKTCKGCRQLQVWQKGVDCKRFNPRFKSEARKLEMCGGKEGQTLLVHVGRLGGEKNIQAIKYILDRVPDTCLAIVGDGPSREELEQHFEGTATKFMGMQSGDALSECFASADIFVMPSETETLGFVVLEAMASGVPCVCVAAGGLIDIVSRPGVTGLMYPPGDYDAAVAHVEALVKDPELRRRIAVGGNEEVQNWSFHASNVNLRENQYTAAIRRFRAFPRIVSRFRALLVQITLWSWLRSLRASKLASAAAFLAVAAAVAAAVARFVVLPA